MRQDLVASSEPFPEFSDRFCLMTAASSVDASEEVRPGAAVMRGSSGGAQPCAKPAARSAAWQRHPGQAPGAGAWRNRRLEASLPGNIFPPGNPCPAGRGNASRELRAIEGDQQQPSGDQRRPLRVKRCLFCQLVRLVVATFGAETHQFRGGLLMEPKRLGEIEWLYKTGVPRGFYVLRPPGVRDGSPASGSIDRNAWKTPRPPVKRRWFIYASNPSCFKSSASSTCCVRARKWILKKA